jgi:hypothetical protein
MRDAPLLASLFAFVLGVTMIPWRLCAQGSKQLLAGDVSLQRSLVRGVEGAHGPAKDRAAFATGSDRFDGEWLFGARMMAAMGIAQVIEEHPEVREDEAARLDACVRAMLDPTAQAFDRDAWGEGPLDTLAAVRGHVAYLGYLNLALGMQRLADPARADGALNDRISEALARRFAATEMGLIETYPGERYPVDNMAAIASLSVHDTAAGSPTYRHAVQDALDRIRAYYIDGDTGLLVQSARSDGSALDGPRGSGTLLGVYFSSFADLRFSRALWDAATAHLGDDVLGFGVMREYPTRSGHGDIDSGPVVLGYGVSATGFALAGARIHGDAERFARLFATAALFGAPLESDGARRYVLGGPLGDAILLAMTTAHATHKGGGA